MNAGDSLHNYVHYSFKHGSTFRIGKFCVIEENVRVGENVTLGSHIHLKSGTRIGDNCFIDSYVSSSGDNWIGDNVTVRLRATLCRQIEVRDNVFISPNVMTIYSDPKGKAKPGTVIMNGAFIGVSCVLNAGILIAEKVVLAPCSFARKSLKSPAGLYNGNPAKLMRKNYAR